jgi:hypothetical protein
MRKPPPLTKAQRELFRQRPVIASPAKVARAAKNLDKDVRPMKLWAPHPPRELPGGTKEKIEKPLLVPLPIQKLRQDAAKKWFIGKAKSVLGYRRKLIDEGEMIRGRDIVSIGKMYFYCYNPKHKATLPIYDIWPLVFPIEKYNDGFLGLNMHYLPNKQRRFFLDGLKAHANNKKFDRTTRLDVRYPLIRDNWIMNLYGTPCIHRYLYKQMLTLCVEIQAHEWDYVIDMPLELFVEK